jgi:hypothetical protein
MLINSIVPAFTGRMLINGTISSCTRMDEDNDEKISRESQSAHRV